MAHDLWNNLSSGKTVFDVRKPGVEYRLVRKTEIGRWIAIAYVNNQAMCSVVLRHNATDFQIAA